MDKIILVFYIDTTGLDPEAALKYCEQIKRSYLESLDKESVLSIFIPTFSSDFNDCTRVECLNPCLKTEEEYKSVLDTLSEIEKNFNSFLDKYKK